MKARDKVSSVDVAHYRRDGFVVLRDAFDAPRLTAEARAALEDGFVARAATNVSAEAAIAFRYLPTMSERAPYCLELLRNFAGRARRLLGTDVLPVRAKAVEYHGSSSWHRDSEADVASAGFACYLEPLTATTGALRVVPGSHRDGRPATGEADRDAVAIETVPDDVIVFDEHLLHSSAGGNVRATRRRSVEPAQRELPVQLPEHGADAASRRARHARAPGALRLRRYLWI